MGLAVASSACKKGAPSSPCPATYRELSDDQRKGDVTCSCASGANHGTVWGASPYTTDSSICSAAVHAGALGPSSSGDVTTRPVPGCSSYGGTAANGVTTSGWGAFPSSFFFPGHGDGKCADGGAPPAAAATPAPAGAAITGVLADGTSKIGPLKPDHEIVTDDGNGNRMILMIANCPQITDSCSIATYLRENRTLLDSACPGWNEIAVAWQPKDQKGWKGPLAISPGKYTSKRDSQPISVAMVEYSEHDPTKTTQVDNEDVPLVDLTRSDDKGMAGSLTAKAKWTKAVIEGAFDAKMCACDQSTGVCK